MDRVTKQTVTLRCLRDDEIIEVIVPAYVYKGLAIHKPVNGKRGWTLSHLESSVSLVSSFAMKCRDIEATLLDIASMMNWEQSFDSIVSEWGKDETLRQRAVRKFSALHG